MVSRSGNGLSGYCGAVNTVARRDFRASGNCLLALGKGIDREPVQPRCFQNLTNQSLAQGLVADFSPEKGLFIDGLLRLRRR